MEVIVETFLCCFYWLFAMSFRKQLKKIISICNHIIQPGIEHNARPKVSVNVWG